MTSSHVYVRVAGLTIHVSSDNAALPIAAAPAASRFLVEPARLLSVPDVEIDVRAGRCHEPRGSCLFDSGGSWRLYQDPAGHHFVFISPRFERPYKTGVFSPVFTTGRITLDESFIARAQSIDPLEYPLDELLVIGLLGSGRGVELHACGVLDGSEGYLFVGQSGAGKTTTARLWLDRDNAVVLSDDRVIVRHDAEGFWIYGTPWHGEEPLASPARARLKAVFLLRQSDRHTLRTIPGSDAVARLFAASFPAFYDVAAVTFTLEFLDRMAATVPVRELGFAPAPTLVDFVRSS